MPGRARDIGELRRGNFLEAQQWLEYAFLSPGFSPQWNAGAVGEGRWHVEYRVFKDSDKKPRITYRFEVDLKRRTFWGLGSRGFKFLGPTVVYAHMQAVGMVNDHVVSCFRHKQLS